MRLIFIIFLLSLVLSCVPDNLYLAPPEICQKPTVGAGFLQSRTAQERSNVKYPTEIYNFPLYCSYGKVYHNGWGVELDVMLPSFSFINVKLVTPKKGGFFASLTTGTTTYYLPYTLSLLIGKEISQEILFFDGIATSDLTKFFSYLGNGFSSKQLNNFRFAYPFGIRARLSKRVEFVSEIILPVISDEALVDREIIAYPRFGSALFYSIK